MAKTKGDVAFHMYVDLMTKCLTDSVYGKNRTIVRRGQTIKVDPKKREAGRDWPVVGHTMIGMFRMRNLADLADRAIQNGIPGDFIETGVWRGGAAALMRGILKARGVTDRRVFVADSFDGLPPPDEKYPADAGSRLHTRGRLAVSQEEVENTFKAYDLLDDQVVFVKGWFKDTLHLVESDQFALIRLDGDMYESTIQAIEALYPRLSSGGYIIVDDYGGIKACAQAIEDYRKAHGIVDEIHWIDHTGIWWQKS
jgi:O-methyltransferase